MVGVNVIAAETDTEARRLFTTQQMSFADMVRGVRRPPRPPIDDIEAYWSPTEKAHAQSMLSRAIIGSPQTVREGLKGLIGETNADELIIVSDVFEHEKRVRSLQLISEA